jgi:LmbE family N-acetylglucosaminyl deacetylase
MALSTLAAEPGRSGAQLLGDLQRLQVLGTALYVAAHPDDENTRLLASLAQGLGVRAVYLSFTRGEGGQNLIGRELGPGLGVIRTQELLAARRIDGAEQRFTRARDFGYSKSVEETLKVWDHDAVLADAVRVIRSVRPDVLITRFPLEAGETHGHHTASARLALEAFRAAGDPTFQPAALAGLAPWQPTRIVWNAWQGDRAKARPGAMTFDSSAYSPRLGRSFGEVAAESRSMHRSQGFGAAPVHGPAPEQFVLLDGTPGTSLFDGVELGWQRVPGSEALSALLSRATASFEVEHPEHSLPLLLEALDAMRALPEHPDRARKLEELGRVIAACAGLFLEVTSPTYTAVPGGSLEVAATALNRSPAAVTLASVRYPDGTVQAVDAALDAGVAWTQKRAVAVPPSTPLSNPAWLDAPPRPGLWTELEPGLGTLPERPPTLAVDFELAFGARRLTLSRPVSFTWVDPTAGERARPIEVLPAVTVAPDTRLLLFTDAAPRALTVRLTAQADVQAGEVHLELPAGWTAEPRSQRFELPRRGGEQALAFSVRPSSPGAAGPGTLTAVAQVGGQRFTRGHTRLEYAHLPIQTLLPVAEVQLSRVKLERGGASRIGYLEGAGDEVPQALRRAGYAVTLLDEEALEGGSLAGYDAVVLGVRAYNVNPKLPGWRARLLQYVADGGTLVVQYNTRNWLSEVPAELGPFPFALSQERVTDETAQVTFAAPVHRVLTSPNRLGPADFEGWVQERGLYFAGSWDPRYQTPLAMNDPGEPPRQGSLLVARHGKGTFVYTGLAFFRQLPAGVPGAYRLFANLLAHGT